MAATRVSAKVFSALDAENIYRWEDYENKLFRAWLARFQTCPQAREHQEERGKERGEEERGEGERRELEGGLRKMRCVDLIQETCYNPIVNFDRF